MKKTITLLLILALALSLAACAAKTPESAAKTISPLPATLTADTKDMTCAASFTPEDIGTDEDGKPTLTFTIYDYELFDAVDISQMAAGDTLMINGSAMEIKTIEQQGDTKVINGGLENGGCYLLSNGGGTFREQLWDDAKNYFEVGTVTLPVSESFALTDSSELNAEPKTLTLADLASMPEDAITFNPRNTTLSIEAGVVTEGKRCYTP